MLHTPRINRAPLRFALSVFGLVILGGCSTYPTGNTSQSPQYVLSHDAASTIGNDTINDFLERSPPGAIMSAASSPWGANVEIVADEPYLAASGRECRRLQVVGTAGDSRRALACKTPEGWVNQRVVTQSVEGRFQ